MLAAGLAVLLTTLIIIAFAVAVRDARHGDDEVSFSRAGA
jgi:hypothetical protein